MPKEGAKEGAKEVNSACPCGSRRRYARCCEPYLTGKKVAPTAEALMRSRYTAFCKGEIDYLINTHRPSNHASDKRPSDERSSDERSALAQTIRNTQWLNLIVLSAQKGQRKDKQGAVEFAAAYREKAGATVLASEVKQLHERSQFIKEAGQWFYTGGERLAPFVPKRNQACWCGSGRQFRQCHVKER